MNNVLEHPSNEAEPNLSWLAITLLKGVLYKQDNPKQWDDLLRLQARLRDYFAVINLHLMVDEAEGYAYVKSPQDEDLEDTDTRLPRLVVRRALSFPVSLLVALLRKKLAEFDAGGDEDGVGSKLVLSRQEIVELVRVFLPDTSNEARLLDQIDTHINRVIDLGFLRRLKNSSGSPSFEVRRIIKAYVDAQWLAEFDQRLADYQTQLSGIEDDTQ